MRGWMCFTVAALLASVAGGVGAVQVTMSFQAIGRGVTEPLATPVSGTITWDADSPGAPIKSLTSIDLTIAGYTYTLDEVGFESPFIENQWTTLDVIGGKVGGVVAVMANVDDFMLQFDRATLTPIQFWYGSPQVSNDLYMGREFAPFSVGVSAVPEPGTFALLGVAFAGIGLARLRRRR